MKHKKRYSYMLLSVVITFVMTIVAVWVLMPLSDNDLRNADATLERADRFLLIANSDTLLAFSYFDEKKEIRGVVSNIDSAQYLPVSQHGLWVNRMPVIPSCSGRLVVLSENKEGLCNLSSEELHTIIGKEAKECKARIEFYQKEIDALEYYMKTHSVIDEGFDLVARYDKTVRQQVDSLSKVVAMFSRIGPKALLKLKYSPVFTAYINKGGTAVKARCKYISQKGDVTLLRTMNNECPEGGTKLSVYDKTVRERLIAKRVKTKNEVILSKDTRVDKEGIYTGEMDSVGMSHGFGRMIANDGSYYEGNWVHGKREGFGFAMTQNKKLKVGEWKEDRYLGEIMNYTTDRIYGIDISRHQHEIKGKRYGIDWGNLSITGLGTISKKKISGEVNYPISFVYIKSTESDNIKNQYFASDYDMAKKCGYKVGAYHFFSCRTTADVQARYFLSNTKYQKGDFPPVLDVEPFDNQIAKMGGDKVLYKRIKEFCNMVEKAWNVRPVLYLSEKFIRVHLKDYPDLLKDYRIWIARYGQYRPEVNLVYWQLCPDGRVKGIHGEMDINVFNGFEKEFKAYAQ